jgi:hypothetical protein
MPPVVVQRDESHLGYIDMNQREVRNHVLHLLASDPGSPIDGQILYRTDTDKIRARINGAWQDLATMADVTAGGISSAIIDAKGDLIVGSAADTAIREAVGATGTVYVANSANAGGHEWRLLTEADIQMAATDRLLGRDTAAGGPAEELTVGGGVEFTGSGGIQIGAFTGDVTKAAGSTVTALGAGVIVDGDVNASAAIAATKVAVAAFGSNSGGTLQASLAELETDLTTLIGTSVQGFDWKEPVRAASTGNLTLTAPGATIDGVTMAAGDRFLAKDQSTGGQNGIYIWTGAASTATRATDMDVNTEADNATVLIEEGTVNKGDIYTQTASIATLGTTAMVWVKSSEGNAVYTADETTLTLAGQVFSIKAAGVGATQLAAAVAGNGLTGGAGTALAVGAGTGISVAADAVAVDVAVVERHAVGALTGGANSEVLTHNLNTRDVTVTIRNNATPWDQIEVYNEATSVNTVTVYAASGNNLPASYRWKVSG